MTSHKSKLNDKQIHILKLTYKFRYLTTNNLARRLNITHNSAYSALTILNETGYLGKLYDKSYKFAGKSARYYLTPDAVKFLSGKEHGLSKKVLLTRRREAEKSTDFIDLQVELFKLYLDIKDTASDELVALTATEMGTLKGFIWPYPGLYVQNRTTGKQSFIELTDGQHLFLAKKRIRRYIQHYESDNWEGDKYPEVVIVRSRESERKQLDWYIKQQLEDKYLDESDIRIRAVSGQVKDILA
ncbi:MAG TPA: replication-relaxation family protein [Candidatus Limnocylindria bacterium]|nr:replication-relaxation family protein [Candidatus Limnocylindria bacterium]